MEIKSIKDEDQLKQAVPGDILQLKIENFPARAKIVTNNHKTRVVTLKYRKKRLKTHSTRIVAFTYDEIIEAYYRDNTKKWAMRGLIVAVGAVGSSGIIATASPNTFLELIKFITELLSSL